MNERARHALEGANNAVDATTRRLWLLCAIELIVDRSLTLVGGAAVDVHTGSYRPTDVDIVGVVGANEREALIEAGFEETGGRHLKWTPTEGDPVWIEFPESHLDGTYITVNLADTYAVRVISLESLVIDRMVQATDGTDVTFDEAVRLVAATDDVDWDVVVADIALRRDTAYLKLHDMIRRVLAAAGRRDLANHHFPT